MRDPDVDISMFDEMCFSFYLVKYGEIFGVETLIAKASTTDTLSYDQKVQLIEHMVKSEHALNVIDSSRKHCLLWLLLNGSIT